MANKSGNISFKKKKSIKETTKKAVKKRQHLAVILGIIALVLVIGRAMSLAFWPINSFKVNLILIMTIGALMTVIYLNNFRQKIDFAAVVMIGIWLLAAIASVISLFASTTSLEFYICTILITAACISMVFADQNNAVVNKSKQIQDYTS